MLEAARLEADRAFLNRTAFDLADVVFEQAEAFSSVSDAHSIHVVKPRGPAVVSADRDRISTVVANLIDNAIKYSADATEVRIDMGERDGLAFVAVRDFGVGIAPEHIPLLFQRFGRLPTERNVTTPGTGLGLYLCQEIARRHGGAISVASTPGQGSEFILRLPSAPSG
jgi:signal transduction histidine kinase